MLRIVAVLGILVLLGACGSSGSLGRRYFAPAPAQSGGLVTPGPPEHIDSNVGNTVYFDTNSALLQPEAQQMLQKQAMWLQVFPQYAVTVEGHADERGTREYNLALGERRAQAVMDYLIALGINPKRLKTISYGKERPVCSEATEACWSQNRRSVTVLDN